MVVAVGSAPGQSRLRTEQLADDARVPPASKVAAEASPARVIASQLGRAFATCSEAVLFQNSIVGAGSAPETFGAARAGYGSATVMPPAAPLQFVILLVASWLQRRQSQAIEYLRAENRVLRARLGPNRLRFTDAERRLLADKGKPLGRKLLTEMATLATPDTILR
jgi:hypothetical protein